MLNWRPVREIEQRTKLIEIEILRELQKQQQIENEIRQIERDIEQIERETKLIERETKLIERETEQIEKETEQLRQDNAKTRHLISCVDQLCFPPESSSNPAPPTASDCKPSSP
jgi:septal ring factor EnvC (AmiA/AmiB activator)